MAGFIVTCLVAGFAVFPGLVCMHLWNLCASFAEKLPSIGLFQGLLLWGIMVAAYFTFRKQKLVVCMKTPQGLSEEELKAVFADIKKQTQDDTILQAMIKAREAELKLKEDQKEVVKDEVKSNHS